MPSGLASPNPSGEEMAVKGFPCNVAIGRVVIVARCARFLAEGEAPAFASLSIIRSPLLRLGEWAMAGP